MINDYILRSIIYGGIDGIITMFNIISGITGAKLNYKYIFIIGLAVLISDGMSMGISDYLSLKADIKLKQNYKKNNLVNEIKPVKNGLITFSSFIVFGFIPIFLYFIFNNSKSNKYFKLIICITISLFLLGSVQSRYTDEPWYFTGTKLSVFGIITATISYNISRIIMTTLK
jgi:VIT1/CCC1 family predicted Fe2+/Mn2+ transporter